MRVLLLACCILIASVSVRGAAPPAAQTNDTGLARHVTRNGTDLAAALVNSASADTVSASTAHHPHVPSQLLIKFKESRGGMVAEIVNGIAGIDLIKVRRTD